MAASKSSNIPFSSLPLDPNGPSGNSWGRFGSDDQHGTLNFLTPATVAAAAQEIKTGVRKSLDWSLNQPKYPFFGRVAFEHEVRTKGGFGRAVNDDFLTFNTQGGSQWDGLRHFGYLKEDRYYNGTSPEQIFNGTHLGIDAWVSSGGIVGRGVLLDYARWARKHSIALDPFSNTSVPVSHLERLVAEQNIIFKPGDILFIRFGFTEAYEALSDSEQRAIPERPSADFIGVEPAESMLKWLWDNQFAAVAGDVPAFESAPVGGKGVVQAEAPFMLHQWLLAGWGMPIGELFDLEELARHCEETGRKTFFVSSVPLKVPGGVASPPNAVAIF